MAKIVIDTGLETYDIEDKNGKKLGSFSMNPSDLEMIKRYDVVAQTLNHIMDDVPDGDISIEEMKKILEEKEQIIRTQIDYLFNADISDEFFKITSPFTPVGRGELFFENVINAIGSLVEAETGKRMKKIESKVNKYAVKYHG